MKMFGTSPLPDSEFEKLMSAYDDDDDDDDSAYEVGDHFSAVTCLILNRIMNKN